MIDFLLVGSGLFNAVFADKIQSANKTRKKRDISALCVEKKLHIGGNCYTESCHGINIHKYGAHIFRTDTDYIWDYVNRFADFNNFINEPMARYKDEIYNLPFNMNTFSKLWKNIYTPLDAQAKIYSQRIDLNREPANLEEYALSVVGTDIYEKLIRGYTEKQWGKPCSELPVSTMKRIPIRYTYNNNYYENKKYQGVPKNGYTDMIQSMFSGIPILYATDGREFIEKHQNFAKYIIYTGCIDEFYDYRFGKLNYRSLRFEEEYFEDVKDFQGVAVVNYTDVEVPYTRIIEHKHFTDDKMMGTVISKEYPVKDGEPYYPMSDEENKALYQKYLDYAKENNPNITFCGRLGGYAYTDMEETILNADRLFRYIYNTIL